MSDDQPKVASEEKEKPAIEASLPPLGAATTAVSGKEGTVTGQTGGSEIKEWAATLTGELLDATNMGSGGWREFILGLQGATGSFSCVGTKPEVETVAALVLETDGAVTPSATISGAALISSVEAGAAVDGIVTYSAEFSFTGVVSVT